MDFKKIRNAKQVFSRAFLADKMRKTRISPFGVDAVICSSVWGKMKGMMFSSKRKKPLLFIFSKEKHVPIHMFFVFFPLIVIWISSKKNIVDYQIMKPFTIYSPRGKARYVLEIPFIEGKNSKIIAKRLKKGLKLKFR